MKTFSPSEALIQKRVVAYLKSIGALFHASPSVYIPNPVTRAKMMAAGFSKGWPDIVAILPNNKVIAIELKKDKGGRASPEQKKWVQALENAGVPARICHGYEAAVAFIEEYQ